MMAFLLRRLLMMVPTFLGITLVTFWVSTLVDQPLSEAISDGQGVLGNRRISRSEALKLKSLSLTDLPAVWNPDVLDAPRTVRRSAERLAGLTVKVAKEWPTRVAAAREVLELPPDPAADAVEGGRLLTRLAEAPLGADPAEWLTFRLPDGRERPLDGSDLEGNLAQILWDRDLLSRLGAQTTQYLEVDSIPGPARPVLLNAARRAVGVPFADLQEAAAFRPPSAPTADSVAEAVAHAERWVAVRDGSPPPTPGDRRAAQDAFEADVSRLGLWGGLAMAELMPRWLEASPRAKEALFPILRDHGGCDVSYRAFTATGSAGGPDLQEVEDRRVARWWSHHRFRYREMSGLERVGLRSWTHTRYARWLTAVCRLDFGESWERPRTVRSLMGERLPVTMALQGAAVLLMYLLGVPLGVWSAWTQGRWPDRVISGATFLLFAAPSFWVASLVVSWAAGWLPAVGLHSPQIQRALEDRVLSPWSGRALWDGFLHSLLPVVVLAYGGIAVLTRFCRSSVLETLHRPWVRAASARGLPRARVVRRHVLRPALTPLVTWFGILVPTLVTGSVVVERVFGISGMGSLYLEAAVSGDVPVVMGVSTLVALATMFGYALSDVLQAWVDPRVRLS